MVEVKVMQVRVDGPRAVKDKCWILVDRPEQSTDQPWWLTPGIRTHAMMWQSGSCCRRDGGRAGHVSRSWGTCTTCDTHCGLVVWPQNHPTLRMTGFAEIGSQNLVVTVPMGIGGGT
jgi:hypothetical protein